MILGKHTLIVRYAARRIAAQLGKTLVTPVIPFVPEGAPFALESNGVSGNPRRASAERGRALIDIKIQAAVRQIKARSD
jgi:creatinine amidohydrolase/Fe(II)-dependent formamide hydrolase-like protein